MGRMYIRDRVNQLSLTLATRISFKLFFLRHICNSKGGMAFTLKEAFLNLRINLETKSVILDDLSLRRDTCNMVSFCLVTTLPGYVGYKFF